MPTTFWNFDRCRKEALKYQTRSAFQFGSGGAYRWALKNNLLNEMCSHMGGNRSWTFEEVREESMKYKTRSEFQRGSPKAYGWAKRKSLIDSVCDHMATSPTLEEVFAEAAKFDTLRDFYTKSPVAYKWAQRNGMLEDVCSHMARLTRIWTVEEAHTEALKYETRKEFQIKSSAAYQWARTHDLLDKICGHMIDGHPSDRNAIYIWQVVGVRYEGARVFKIGMTSVRLDDFRIRQVAQKNGFKADIVALAAVSDASTLEKILHELGKRVHITDGDGKTEFRALNEQELETAIEFIELEAIAA